MPGELLAPHKPENAGIKRSPQETLDELNLNQTKAEQVKAEGNKMLHSGDYATAISRYNTALHLAQDSGNASQLIATLHINKCLAHLKLSQNFEALLDAKLALEHDPNNLKAHYRQAHAQLALSKYKAAMQTARAGERLLNIKSDRQTDFGLLMDQIAMAGALSGDYSGFDGHMLQVRSAGEEAWLGGPAPVDPLLDPVPNPTLSLQQKHTHLPETISATGLELAAHVPNAGAEQNSFRSIKEAVAAAQDGDQVVLLPGIHNGMGETVNITKRILITGSGRLGEAKIDHRANCPIFRITRSAVLQNIELDMTGFREAILIKGGSNVRPVLQHCSIRPCAALDAANPANTCVDGLLAYYQTCPHDFPLRL